MMEGWKKGKLADSALVYSGYAFKSKDMNTESGIPLIKIKNINFNKVSKECDSYLNTKVFDKKQEKYVLKKDDILVAMTGQGSVGRIGKMRKMNKTYLVNQRVGIVRVDKKLADAEYVYQYMGRNAIESVYYNLAMGAGQPNLSPKDIGNLDIYYPPLPTQRKIAKILSAYDDLIENNLKRIKLLEEMAQKTYEEWFVRFKFPGHETAIFDEESGLPEGWERVNFKKILKFRTGKLDSNAVRPNGKYDFYTCAKEVFKTDTYCFDGEAVLLGGNNATGDFALFYAKSKFDAYQRTYIVTSDELPLVYVFYVLKKYLPYFQNVSSGAATKFLTMRILDSTKIVQPSIEIQKKFKYQIEPNFDLVIKLKAQNQHLKEARDILLPRLMTGMISV